MPVGPVGLGLGFGGQPTAAATGDDGEGEERKAGVVSQPSYPTRRRAPSRGPREASGNQLHRRQGYQRVVSHRGRAGASPQPSSSKAGLDAVENLAERRDPKRLLQDPEEPQFPRVGHDGVLGIAAHHDEPDSGITVLKLADHLEPPRSPGMVRSTRTASKGDPSLRGCSKASKASTLPAVTMVCGRLWRAWRPWLFRTLGSSSRIRSFLGLHREVLALVPREPSGGRRRAGKEDGECRAQPQASTSPPRVHRVVSRWSEPRRARTPCHQGVW